MSTDQLALMICLCVMLLTSGSGRFKQRTRRSRDVSYPSHGDLSTVRS